MKQKSILIIGVGVLFILIVTTTLLGKISQQKNKTQTPSRQDGNNKYIPDNNSDNIAADKQNGKYLIKTDTTSLKNMESDITNQSDESSNDDIPTPNEPVNNFYSALDTAIGTNTLIASPISPSSPTLSGRTLLNAKNTDQPVNPTPAIDPLQSFYANLNTLIYGNLGFGKPDIKQPETVSADATPAIPIEKAKKTDFIYYPQCDGPYDDYAIAAKCNICDAGCGPTTTAMILSSYTDNTYTPPQVVELYKSNNLTISCNGTDIIGAQTILQQQGIKTTDLLILAANTIEETVSDFKSYIKNGWTLFTLGNFCEKGCGHFFWIVDIDENNNIWSYDPFYGRKKLPPPFNVNALNPYPKYRVAFGVKKP